MKIKSFATILILVILCSCNGSISQQSDNRHPEVPSLASLQELCKTNYDEIVRVKKNDSIPYDTYYHKDTLFTGCAAATFNDTDHRYRFLKCKKGELYRQIGYYDSGELDHDFMLSNGKNHGSCRMWMANGKPYIEEYYINGIADGSQRRWYSNGQIGRDALFDNGGLVYEKIYDKAGKPKN